jgi:hypothetical protein
MMNPQHATRTADSGSRLHFLIAAVIALSLAIGLTSTAAKAGLMPVAESVNEAPAIVEAVAPTPALARASVTPAPPSPYLEDQEEFAPKFQHIVPRVRR